MGNINRFPPHYRYYLLLIAVIFAWGLNWPITKFGLQFMPSLWFACSRLALASLVLFILLIITGKFALPSKKDWRLILGIGLTQIFFYMLFINLALLHIPAGHGCMLAYTTPLWAIPIAALLHREKLNVVKLLCLSAGLIGIILLLDPNHLYLGRPIIAVSYLLMLFAAICWAIALLMARYAVWHSSPFTLIFWQVFIATIPVAILAALIEPTYTIHWNQSLILACLYNGLIGGAFAYWGSIVVSKELSVTASSLGFIGVPLVGIVFSSWLLHEVLTNREIVAAIFILSALMIQLVVGFRK